MNSVHGCDAPRLAEACGMRLRAFMEKIGFKNPVKLTRYHVWKLYGFCPTNTSLEERYKMIRGEADPRSYYTGP